MDAICAYEHSKKYKAVENNRTDLQSQLDLDVSGAFNRLRGSF